MKKCAANILSLALCLSLLGALLLFSGCNGGAVEPSPTPLPDDVLPVLIMVEDTLYQWRDTLDPSIKIEDSQILGYISKSLPNEIPRHNGEACWVDVGTPYARCPLEEYPEGMVAFFAHQWRIFLPENQVS